MAVFQKAAVAKLLEEMGEKGTSGWSPNRLTLKMKGLPKKVNEDTKVSKESQKVLDAVLKAVKAGDDLEIQDGPAKAPGKAPKEVAETPAPKKGKAPKAADPDEDEDEEDEPEDDEETEDEEGDAEDEEDMKEAEKAFKDDDEDEEPEEEDEEAEEDANVKQKAPKKGKSPKKAKVGAADKIKTPGVIDTIEAVLKAAGEKGKGVTKEQIADKLAKAFPDRERDAMLKTVNVQVPSRLKSDRNLKVTKDDNGYMIK